MTNDFLFAGGGAYRYRAPAGGGLLERVDTDTVQDNRTAKQHIFYLTLPPSTKEICNETGRAFSWMLPTTEGIIKLIVYMWVMLLAVMGRVEAVQLCTEFLLRGFNI
jgi:hypothetical protein